jgi:hypothetical protein
LISSFFTKKKKNIEKIDEIKYYYICRHSLVTALLLLNAGDALVITQMIVPSHVQRGSDFVLRCLYDLDGDSLYSVKWYKGSHGTTFFLF